MLQAVTTLIDKQPMNVHNQSGSKAIRCNTPALKDKEFTLLNGKEHTSDLVHEPEHHILTLEAPIGVIADTHGLLREEAHSCLEGCGLVLHLGDVGQKPLGQGNP